MARPNYGPGGHCQLHNYPQEVRLVVGRLLASGSDLFDEGQVVTLRQTSNSGVLQGQEVVGSELPKKAIIYSDTGDETSFNLKIEFYGWGEFYLTGADVDNFSFRVTKGVQLQAGDWSDARTFQTVLFADTLVPNTHNMQQRLAVPVGREEIYVPDEMLEHGEPLDMQPGGGDDEISHWGNYIPGQRMDNVGTQLQGDDRTDAPWFVYQDQAKYWEDGAFSEE